VKNLGGTNRYLFLEGIVISGDRPPTARLEFEIGHASIKRETRLVQAGDDIFALSKNMEQYRGYRVSEVDPVNRMLSFTNGEEIRVGEVQGDMSEETLRRVQIRETIRSHFEKEKELFGKGIKCLSLFFIDEVAKYRKYDEDGSEINSEYGQIFEAEYTAILNEYLTLFSTPYEEYLRGIETAKTHTGYFSIDKKGRKVDSALKRGSDESDDISAYDLIMKDKERLLSFENPVRFIFSHSALREGWDNPNVFTICTLNETSSEMKKRQEIGRGLRLPVDINGERVHDQNTNVLTVVANESYADFSRKLQTEIEQETGISFSGRIKNRDDRRRVRLTKSLALSGDFKELWERIKHKTVYHVAFDTGELVRRAAEQLALVEPIRPQIVDTRVRIEQLGAERGFMVNETPGAGVVANIRKVYVPDILSVLEKRTGLTRAVIFAVLDKADAFGKLARNPQQMIDEAARAIHRAKQTVMVDGISYQKTGESYDMRLFENHELEAYLYDAAMKSGAIAVEKPDKTVYDYVAVDSEVEYNFMKALEQADNIRFYVKLPGWFTIPTPLGSYNPDWAVVFDGDERVYFVAETKGSNDINDPHLSANERGKILAARQHFAEVGVEYAAPVRELRSVLNRI